MHTARRISKDLQDTPRIGINDARINHEVLQRCRPVDDTLDGQVYLHMFTSLQWLALGLHQQCLFKTSPQMPAGPPDMSTIG
jgi:hypothetical protein